MMRVRLHVVGHLFLHFPNFPMVFVYYMHAAYGKPVTEDGRSGNYHSYHHHHDQPQEEKAMAVIRSLQCIGRCVSSIVSPFQT